MRLTAIYAKTVNAVVTLARFQPIDPATGFPAVDSLNRPLLGDVVTDPVAGAALGTPDDDAWGGTGAASLIAVMKASNQALLQLVANGGAGGGFASNRNSVSTALVVPADSNASLVGPITIEPGASITVPATSIFKVL